MYSYTYISLLCLLYIQNTFAYFAYFIEDRSGIIKYTVDDYIPEWNDKCFKQDIYRNVLCSIRNMKDDCVLYVECVSNYCNTYVIESYQQYARNNGLTGVVFHGNPAPEANCVMPSTFIQEDLSSYTEHAINVEFGYDDTKNIPINITDLYRFGMVSFITIFSCILMINCNRNSTRSVRMWFWSRIPTSTSTPNFNSINVDNSSEEDESNTTQIRILINRTYVASSDSASTSASETPTCAICLEAFENGNTITKLNCNHEFKYECINEWLKKNPRCPLCNAQE